MLQTSDFYKDEHYATNFICSAAKLRLAEFFLFFSVFLFSFVGWSETESTWYIGN
jgi:hypothetical protein